MVRNIVAALKEQTQTAARLAANQTNASPFEVSPTSMPGEPDVVAAARRADAPLRGQQVPEHPKGPRREVAACHLDSVEKKVPRARGFLMTDVRRRCGA